MDQAIARTDSGPVIGTPAYMAPEQFDGKITTASDIFAWGCVITYAATGRTPFGAGTPYAADAAGDQRGTGSVRAGASAARPGRPGPAEEAGAAAHRARAAAGSRGRRRRPGASPRPGCWTRPAGPCRTRAHDVAPTRVEPTADPVPVARLGLCSPSRPWWRPWCCSPARIRPGTTVPNPRAPRPSGAQTSAAPARTGTAGPVDRPGSGGSPAAAAGPGIRLGTRVPATGTAVLGIGEVHRYDVVLAAAAASTCRPSPRIAPPTCCRGRWSARGGGTVAGANLTCQRYGPLKLAGRRVRAAGRWARRRGPLRASADPGVGRPR